MYDGLSNFGENLELNENEDFEMNDIKSILSNVFSTDINENENQNQINDRKKKYFYPSYNPLANPSGKFDAWVIKKIFHFDYYEFY